MLAEIAAGISSLKTAKDIVQGLNAAKTDAAINGVKIELQGLILEANQGLFAAQEAQSADARRITNLEQEIMRLKDWATEKQSYELKAITPRAFAYVKKPGVEGSEDRHWLCQRCFDEGHKSALQWAGKMISPPYVSGSFASWYCSRCSSEVHVGRNQSPAGDDPDV